WFRAKVHEAGGGNYQTMINNALKEWIQSRANEGSDLESTIRRVIREELGAVR
ncbi:MAG: CopG family transcriptional regulator, partial [Acidobacteriota bacterium]